ncbi:DUF427 domain-containing protein [Phenylobacterium sp. LjRoot225]|uniref:DUF427 domain-containing protein n=1 Tax=Phenylobacterium sp. LjRoot225 TaxID=3342285 RepID=UPI003ECFAEC0
MLTPGPDHPITLEPSARRWRAYFNGHVIADTNDALILREADLAPVVYFPRHDVSVEYMGRTAHQTHCPYKGDAAHYTLTLDGEIAENVAWSYESPFEAMSPIRERLAFYPGRVEVYDIDDAAVNPHPRERAAEVTAREEVAEVDDSDEIDEIDEIVRHTDSGSGASQGEHWPPNVSGPDQGGAR